MAFGPFALLRAAASVLAERSGLASLAGITFDGARDLFIALGYKRELRPNDYVSRYRRDALGARIVESLPRDTWRAGGEIVEDEDSDTETAFEQAWLDFDKRLNVWPTFLRADILAGLGRFAIILIGAPGDLADPLPDRIGPEDIQYLTPFGEEDVTITKLITDPQSPKFGLPEGYSISRIGGSLDMAIAVRSSRATIVHESRVLHVADGLLTDRIYGKPRLEGVWNLLDDLQKVVGGGSEAFWRRAHQGYHFNLDKDLTDLTAPQITDLQQKADDFANGLSRTMATKGMDVSTFGSDVANFGPQVDSIVTMIAASTGIPKRILMGSERGELASSQDRTNWNDRITDRRTSYAGPQFVRPFVDLLIRTGVLPEPKEYNVRWPEIQFLTEQEQAAVAVQWANLNKNIGEVVVTANEIRDRILGLEPLEEGADDPNVVADGRLVASATKICEDVHGSTISYVMGVGLLQLLGMTEEAAKATLGPEAAIPEPAPPPLMIPGMAPNAPPGTPGAPKALPPAGGAVAASDSGPVPPVPPKAAAATYELVLDLPERLVLAKAQPRRLRKRVERDAEGNISALIEEEDV